MMTAIVRYTLPPHIDAAACREHFHRIAPGFASVPGLLSRHLLALTDNTRGTVERFEEQPAATGGIR